MTLAQLTPIAIAASMFVIVFALGLDATFRDAAFLFRRPGLLVRSILAMNVVMLLFALAAAALFDLAPAIKIALVALAVSPVPPILPAKQEKAGGSESYTIGLLVAASLAAMVLVPAAIELVGLLFGRDVHVRPAALAPAVLISVIVPLALGILVRWLAPAFATRIARPVSVFGILLLAAACLPILFNTLPKFWGMVGGGIILVLVLFTAIGLAVGHLLGGPDPDDRTVLALATATRHPGVVIAIANATYPDEKAVLIVVIYHLVIGAVASLPYVNWRKRRHALPEPGR